MDDLSFRLGNYGRYLPLHNMTDAPFGNFKYDATDELYEIEVSHRGNDLKLFIRVDDGFSLDDAIPVASEFWKRRANWFKTARETASSELLDMLNDRIDGENLPPISKTAFAKSLSVPDEICLSVDSDQISFELSYYSDLYGEHAVSVAINLTYDSVDADIANLY